MKMNTAVFCGSVEKYLILYLTETAQVFKNQAILSKNNTKLNSELEKLMHSQCYYILFNFSYKFIYLFLCNIYIFIAFQTIINTLLQLRFYLFEQKAS